MVCPRVRISRCKWRRSTGLLSRSFHPCLTTICLIQLTRTWTPRPPSVRMVAFVATRWHVNHSPIIMFRVPTRSCTSPSPRTKYPSPTTPWLSLLWTMPSMATSTGIANPTRRKDLRASMSKARDRRIAKCRPNPKEISASLHNHSRSILQGTPAPLPKAVIVRPRDL